MAWLQWLHSPNVAVTLALGGWLAIGWVTSRLATLMTIGSIIKTVWRWIRGRRQDSDKSQQTTQSVSGGIGNIGSPLTGSQQVSGNDNVVTGKNSKVHIGDNITHDSRTIVKNTTVNKLTIIQRKLQRYSKRPASQQPPGSLKRRVTALDESPPDTRFPTAVVPLPTPGEAQPQTDSEKESVTARPASSADSSAEPSNHMTSVARDNTVIEEAELIDQESSANDVRQAGADSQAIPTSDEGAEFEVGTTANTGADGDVPGADVDLLPLGEAVVAPEDASPQARAEEAAESAHNQERYVDQLTIENPEPDTPQDESDTTAGAAASIADAMSVAQLTVRTDEPESHLSGEQESLVEASSALSTQLAEAKAYNIDRDIAAIAVEWSAAVIGDTLQRLRRARGLSRTDLSYDPGWVMAFEAGCWHTYETDRRCFVRAIHTYLQTLGMTTAELRACLLQQDTDE